jgi:5,10-methylene-tetrahydrofolate dehydrogenase/methenyl tetrahydrofolate cyclohydrolase
MATELLSSDPFVAEHVLPQQIAVDSLRLDGYTQGIAAVALGAVVEGGTPLVANVAPGVERAKGALTPHPTIIPYMNRLGMHLKNVGMAYFPEIYQTAEDAQGAVDRHQALGNKVIVMLPCEESVIATLMPDADIDGLTDAGKELSYPATSLAVIDYAHQAMPGGLERVDPERITFIGQGRLVNAGAIERLKENWDITPGRIIDRTNSAEELPRLHRTSDLVISAVGVPGLINTEHLLRTSGDRQNPITVIDAGVQALRGHNIVYGDVHAAVYFYDGDQQPRVSPAPVRFGKDRIPFGSGVGALTVAWLANNAIAALERAAELNAPTGVPSLDPRSAERRETIRAGAR